MYFPRILNHYAGMLGVGIGIQMIYEESLLSWFVYIVDCPISLFLAKCAGFHVGTYWKDVTSAPIDTTSRTTVKLELNLTYCHSVHCGES